MLAHAPERGASPRRGSRLRRVRLREWMHTLEGIDVHAGRVDPLHDRKRVGRSTEIRKTYDLADEADVGRSPWQNMLV
jgi:hypothetical protein